MGLFSFFNKKDMNSNGVLTPNPETQQNPIIQQTLPEIPENVFLEKEKPQNNSNYGRDVIAPEEQGIQLLFQFLDKNYEHKGYDDALINPDSTHLEQNVEALKNDLGLITMKIKTYYSAFINEINFHISSRSRSGMIDTVDELNGKKETAETYIKQVLDIENDLKENKGIGQGVILSYTKGFRNGLAAISHHSIMKKKL